MVTGNTVTCTLFRDEGYNDLTASLQQTPLFREVYIKADLVQKFGAEKEGLLESEAKRTDDFQCSTMV
uniref:Uncharacterized protein n=2 Tax=Oryza TaxID=4527 RepID=Q6Z034_ORYSJ|nr:hypothetical protein [Oryza sativa Japonica Group]BAD05693.1 hypothetical protein [Oryza sativa Japonica Group]